MKKQLKKDNSYVMVHPKLTISIPDGPLAVGEFMVIVGKSKVDGTYTFDEICLEDIPYIEMLSVGTSDREAIERTIETFKVFDVDVWDVVYDNGIEMIKEMGAEMFVEVYSDFKTK